MIVRLYAHWPNREKAACFYDDRRSPWTGLSLKGMIRDFAEIITRNEGKTVVLSMSAVGQGELLSLDIHFKVRAA